MQTTRLTGGYDFLLSNTFLKIGQITSAIILFFQIRTISVRFTFLINAYTEFIKTCGTDFHHEGHQGLGATLTKTLPEDSVGIAEILKSRDYLFDVAGNIIIP